MKTCESGSVIEKSQVTGIEKLWKPMILRARYFVCDVLFRKLVQ
jgi:hypothetical protein